MDSIPNMTNITLTFLSFHLNNIQIVITLHEFEIFLPLQFLQSLHQHVQFYTTRMCDINVSVHQVKNCMVQKLYDHIWLPGSYKHNFWIKYIQSWLLKIYSMILCDNRECQAMKHHSLLESQISFQKRLLVFQSRGKKHYT
jgi:hypothetical protein